MLRWNTLVLEVCMALLSGLMYSFAERESKGRESKRGLCELVCVEKTKILRVVPCFVLPVAGCAGQELQARGK
jgi:hypothetical protein